MKRYTNSVTLFSDPNGKNPDEGASIKVYISEDPKFQTLATLFSDDAGTVPLPQPFPTNTLSEENPGRFTFVIADETVDIVANEELGNAKTVIPSQEIKAKDSYRLTEAKMISAKFLRENDTVIVTDRESATGVVVSGETPNTHNIINLPEISLQWKLNKTTKLVASHFGVKYDGITDDTAAWVAALVELTIGGELTGRSDKTSLLSATLAITTNKIKLSTLGILKAISASYAPGGKVIDVNADDVTLKNFTIDQDNINTGRSIDIANASRTTIDGLKSINVQQAFIRIKNNAIDTTVINCRHKSKGYGILVDDTSGSSGLYTNENVFDLQNGNGDGIEINCPTNGFDKFSLENDRILNCAGGALSQGIGIGVAKGTNGRITNATIKNLESDGIHIENSSKDIVITDCIIDGVCSDGTTSSGGMLIASSDNIIAANNIIKDVKSGKHGVVLSRVGGVNSNNCKIENIIVDGVDGSNVLVTGSVDCSILNMTLKNGNRANAGAFGIRVTLTAAVNTGLDISGIKIIDGTTPLAKAIDVSVGAMTSGSIANCNLSGCVNNRITDNGSNGFSRWMNIRSKTDLMRNTVTVGAATTTTVVTNGNSEILEEAITIKPLNASAAALTDVYVSVSNAAGFTITHSLSVGGEIFGYEINS